MTDSPGGDTTVPEGTWNVPPPRPPPGDAAVPPAAVSGAPPAEAEQDADQAVWALYSAHHRGLVRLAALLVGDIATAEDVVHDSFAAMHGAWHRLRDSDTALSYLRRSVVNRSRSLPRHRAAVRRRFPSPAPRIPSAEQGAPTPPDLAAVIAALRTISPRQREALVLKYYLDLPDAEIAHVMGISKGAVQRHTSRAMASLRAVLDR